MAAIAILKIEKSPYLSNGSTDFDHFWHGDVVRPSGSRKIVENLKFYKSKMAAVEK